MITFKKGVILLLLISLVLVLIGCGNVQDDGGGDINPPDPEDERILPCRECDTGEYAKTVTKMPGCFEDGEESYVCQVCGHSYTSAIPETRELRILSVGDYSSFDALSYLDEVLSEMGVQRVVIAHLNSSHATGAVISDHLTLADIGKTPYTLTVTENGSTEIKNRVGLDEGLRLMPWDAVILNQAIKAGADEGCYSTLGELCEYVKERCDAKIYLGVPRSFEKGSAEEKLLEFSGDSRAMYLAITERAKEAIDGCSALDGVIPYSTLIENLRESYPNDELCDVGIRLISDKAKVACSELTASVITDRNASEVECKELDALLGYSKETVRATVKNTLEKRFEVNAIMVKEIKILIFGNSYGNDATRYLERMLRLGDYERVVIGHVGESSMLIRDHYHNIDDDPNNDYVYNGKPFSVHYKTVNGESIKLEADYKSIVANEPWDHILFYQGPNSADALSSEEYYGELSEFVSALKEYSTNPDCKIHYYMTWAHNVKDTRALYEGIVSVTDKLIVPNPDIAGILPAATLIENLRTSYLKSGAGGDITRDWGHLNYGVGRYAMALLWYVYLTGGEVTDIDFMPTKEADATAGELEAVEQGKASFTDVDENNLKVIRECVINAMKDRFTVTESEFKEAP